MGPTEMATEKITLVAADTVEVVAEVLRKKVRARFRAQVPVDAPEIDVECQGAKDHLRGAGRTNSMSILVVIILDLDPHVVPEVTGHENVVVAPPFPYELPGRDHTVPTFVYLSVGDVKCCKAGIFYPCGVGRHHDGHEKDSNPKKEFEHDPE